MRTAIVAVIGLVLGICVSADAGYRTEATVTPGPGGHQYLVKFEIMDVGADGKTDMLSAPRLLVEAGEEGKAAFGTLTDNVSCSALVAETDTGVEVTTAVTVKEKGTVTLSTSQKIKIGSAEKAAKLAAKLANDEFQRAYGYRPFKPESYTARFAEPRWYWGKIDPAGTGGCSAKVDFDEDGSGKSVEVAFHTDTVDTEKIMTDRVKKLKEDMEELISD